MKQCKKEVRLQKKVEKQLKQKEKNIRLSSDVEFIDKYIRVMSLPSLDKNPRAKSPDNYKECYLTWCSSHKDVDGEWTWEHNEPRQWQESEYTELIEPHLNSYINDPWKIVESKTYNGSGNVRKLLNKYQPLDSVCNEAQIRWFDLDLVSQFDEFFRFRMGTNRRAWGIRIQHHFYLVWYERHHQICPIDN
jgi:hypothetical protein